MVPMLLDDLLPGHADAVVGHRDRPRRRVVADPDAELGVVFEERGVAHRLEPQLVGGIRGIRDELAQEISLLPYKEWIIRCRSCETSAWNSRTSLVDVSGMGVFRPGATAPISL